MRISTKLTHLRNEMNLRLRATMMCQHSCPPVTLARTQVNQRCHKFVREIYEIRGLFFSTLGYSM
jgi:hypothetical protein